MRPWFRVLVVLLYAFLLAPLAIVLLTSFSDDAYLSFPPQNWGVSGWRAMWGNAGFRRGLGVSLVVAAATVAITLPVGTAAAYALARRRVPGRAALLALFTAPLLVPAIILGLGLLLVFAGTGLLASVPGLVAAHSLLALPFVVRVVLTSLGGIPAAPEEAAATLGATRWRVFWHVTLPLMRPGLVAAGVLAFLASFDDVVVSLFLVGPRLTTLPIEVFHTIQYRADPQISALSVALIVFTTALVLVVERTLGLTRALGR